MPLLARAVPELFRARQLRSSPVGAYPYRRTGVRPRIKSEGMLRRDMRYPAFRAVTFHELESIITPWGPRYLESRALSAAAISSWRRWANSPASR